MSEQLTGSRAPAVSEVMSSLQFQDELLRVARFDLPHAGRDPLAEAVQTIQDNPAFAQSRLLGRLLAALTYQRGEFRRAEAAALDLPTRRVVIALINASRAGTTERDDWVNAVTAAELAQAG